MFNMILVLNYFKSIVFGNFIFFDLNSFEEYFISKYKLTKSQIERVFLSCLLLSLLLIGFQMIFTENFSIEGILVELIIVIALLRLFNYIIFLQYKDYCTIIETVGYFVVNELLVILDTSCSLKEASKFIISSKYPIFSEIFKRALIDTHFGKSIELALKKQIKKQLNGNIQNTFLYILETWENGNNLALLSKNRILSRISEQITEETDKIDSWASLSAGLIFLCPPVIICFLLLSGNMSILFGLLLIVSIVVGSFFIHPERQLTVFSGNNQLYLSYDKKSLEVLIILAENLLKGNSFEKSLNNSLNIVTDGRKYNHSKGKLRQYAQFMLGHQYKSNMDFLADILPARILHLVSLAKKFSMVNTFTAGNKLLTITSELNKTNELLNIGTARLRAAKLHANIIQILALISFAFVAGASPFFLFVSNVLNHSYTEVALAMKNSIFELIYLMIALVISILPIRRVNIGRFGGYNKIKLGGIFRISRFLLFLIVYTLIKTMLRGLY